jgi:hypothetical protein
MAEEITEVKNKKQVRGIVPRKEVDIIAVATFASRAWKESGLTLRWINPDEMLADTMEFKSTFDANMKTSGERRVVTNTLKAVNTEINLSLKYLKGYIADEFDSNGVHAYYPQFGIAKEKKMFVIPRDNDRRKLALEQMLKALARYDFGKRKYGLEYWGSLYDRFIHAKSEASGHDSDSAGQISVKTDLNARIIKTLNALICLVKANYPESWREELRVWGFQKEKY